MSIDALNPLTRMLGNAFDRLDQDNNGGLDRSDFHSMYELLKPGIAVDVAGKPQFTENDEFQRMDHNADGQVSKEELQTTGVLMPATLTDDSLTAMIAYLHQLDTLSAKTAAAQLATAGESTSSAPVPGVL